MKKTLFTIAILFVLTGCSGKQERVTQNIW